MGNALGQWHARDSFWTQTGLLGQHRKVTPAAARASTASDGGAVRSASRRPIASLAVHVAEAAAARGGGWAAGGQADGQVAGGAGVAPARAERDRSAHLRRVAHRGGRKG